MSMSALPLTADVATTLIHAAPPGATLDGPAVALVA
jgi:hypothetical protein